MYETDDLSNSNKANNSNLEDDDENAEEEEELWQLLRVREDALTEYLLQ